MKRFFWLLVVMGVAYVVFEAWVGLNMRLPRRHILADVTNQTVRVDFLVPFGRRHNLALGVRGVKDLSELEDVVLQGDLRVMHGKEVIYQRQLSGEDRSQVFWLCAGELAGMTLTSPLRTSESPLWNALEEGALYSAEVVFTSPPPLQSSLWISWRATRREAAQSRATDSLSITSH
jgi:hypothetical protein